MTKKGCLTALLLGLGLCGVFYWRLGAPHRLAMEAHPKIRPGMTLRELYAVTYLVPGVPPRTSFTVHMSGGKVTSVSAPRSWD